MVDVLLLRYRVYYSIESQAYSKRHILQYIVAQDLLISDKPLYEYS